LHLLLCLPSLCFGVKCLGLPSAQRLICTTCSQSPEGYVLVAARLRVCLALSRRANDLRNTDVRELVLGGADIRDVTGVPDRPTYSTGSRTHREDHHTHGVHGARSRLTRKFGDGSRGRTVLARLSGNRHAGSRILNDIIATDLLIQHVRTVHQRRGATTTSTDRPGVNHHLQALGGERGLLGLLDHGLNRCLCGTVRTRIDAGGGLDILIDRSETDKRAREHDDHSHQHELLHCTSPYLCLFVSISDSFRGGCLFGETLPPN
jgi:hypothetical protein